MLLFLGNRISKFYVTLLEDNDVIETLDGIGSYLMTTPDPEALDSYKISIAAEANAMTTAIKKAIEEEERAIHQKVLENVKSVTELVKCSRKDDDHGADKVIGELAQLEEATNNQDNLYKV